jgi:hypothetical protein
VLQTRLAERQDDQKQHVNAQSSLTIGRILKGAENSSAPRSRKGNRRDWLAKAASCANRPGKIGNTAESKRVKGYSGLPGSEWLPDTCEKVERPPTVVHGFRPITKAYKGLTQPLGWK